MCMLDTIRAKRDEIHAIARKHKAERLWVFGSVARREENSESDVDFLVQFPPHSDFGAPIDLSEEFNDLLGCKVDIVSAQGLSPYIGKRIRREAVPV